MTMTKNARLFAVKEIIGSKQIGNQDELRLELKKRGFAVTQATLSRDLRELGVGRIASGPKPHYVFQAEAERQILTPIVGSQVVFMNANENMIVIRTLPACANVVAEFIDTLQHPDIIGTLAGDNTLLVIPRSQKKTEQLLRLLKEKFTEGQS